MDCIDLFPRHSLFAECDRWARGDQRKLIDLGVYLYCISTPIDILVEAIFFPNAILLYLIT